MQQNNTHTCLCRKEVIYEKISAIQTNPGIFDCPCNPCRIHTGNPMCTPVLCGKKSPSEQKNYSDDSKTDSHFKAEKYKEKSHLEGHFRKKDCKTYIEKEKPGENHCKESRQGKSAGKGGKEKIHLQYTGESRLQKTRRNCKPPYFQPHIIQHWKTNGKACYSTNK